MSELVRVGDVVRDRYRLVGELGRGGMGVVWHGVDLTSGEEVALKFVQLATAGLHATERFFVETRALRRLAGPHTVRILDCGEVTPDGTPYLAMELLCGEDLRSILSRRGRLPALESIRWIREAAEGVAEAHVAGIVHRDLKPSNLFVAESLEGPLVKVIDFGLAKVRASARSIQALTKTGSTFGSLRYASPEQALSAKDADARSDVWSLGVTLYELIAGRTPFDAPTEARFRANVALEDPLPLSASFDVPRGLDELVARALAKAPERRHADAQALVDALAALERSAGSSAPRTDRRG